MHILKLPSPGNSGCSRSGMSPPDKYDPGGTRTTLYFNMNLVCSVRTLVGAESGSRYHGFTYGLAINLEQ